MSIAVTDDHLALAATVRRFVEARCPPAVARADLDAVHERRPAFWDELAALGWLGLHIAEADGGQGFGVPELAVVVEELGRAGAPGPFLPTVLAADAVSEGGTNELRSEVLPELSCGRAIGALAMPGCSVLRATAPDGDGTIVVSGTVRPVLGGALADWLVLPVAYGDDERWCVLATAEVTTVELASMDPTRRCAAVSMEGVSVPACRQLDPSAGARSRDVIAALVAAECAGGAAWCVETASAYAKVREQFGRPIGQFQGVKHRCADMLVATEQARAVAWDAARALDEARPGQSGGDGIGGVGGTDRGIGAGGAGEPEGSSASDGAGGASLAAAIAAAVAPDAFCSVAKDCIQVLGGIGFTWDHDAHRYLRRATAMRQLLGGTAPWRRRVADAAASGQRRRLHLELPGGDEAVLGEVRTTVERIARSHGVERRAALVETGYLVAHWPPPWGRAAGPVEQLLIDAELDRAGVHRPHLNVGAWAAPTIVAHGTPAQQERWVRPTLLGQISWCQMFSEPGAGSDLASLTTRAVRAKGGLELSGQKVWTSLAADADWGICLARTQTGAPKHLGITYFVVDMTSPGIEVRPLRELTGHAMFNEVFLSEVFVADDAVIGEVDGGWALARTTLANERVAMGAGSSFGGGIEALLTLIGDGAHLGPVELGPVALDELGSLLAEAHSVALLGLRATARALAGVGPGPESSVRKLLGVEHDQRTQEFGLGLLGAEGATTEGSAAHWALGFLANRCLTIAGGTSEVQRNVIGERLLGLPRDPEPR